MKSAFVVSVAILLACGGCLSRPGGLGDITAGSQALQAENEREIQLLRNEKRNLLEFVGFLQEQYGLLVAEHKSLKAELRERGDGSEQKAW